MIFSSDEFNAHIADMGQRFLWRRAYACPCVNPTSGQAKPSCPLCMGKGRQWDAGIFGHAGFAGQKVQRRFAELGVWQNGDVALTIGSDSPLYGMGPFDRVVAVDTQVTFSTPLIRGKNDKLRFPVICVERVFHLDAAGVTVIENALPTVGEDGSLTWGVNDAQPAAGQTYSISGKKQVEYFCFTDLPNSRNNFSGTPLPRRVLVRDFDVYGR